jgi:hypothetical protein
MARAMTTFARATLPPIPRRSVAPSAQVPTKVVSIFAWSLLSLTFSGLVFPLGALHALSIVLDVRNAGGRWQTGLAALLLGGTIAFTHTGLVLDIVDDPRMVRAELALQVSTARLASGRVAMEWGEKPTLSARIGLR